MPFVFDMSNSVDGSLNSVVIEPTGWKGPITIEYCVAQAHKYDPVVSVVWRIKGTTHCFTIDERHLNVISNGNYAQHFSKALEAFRIDYLSWFTDEMYKDCAWRKEYEQQYGRLIIPEQSGNQESKNK